MAARMGVCFAVGKQTEESMSIETGNLDDENAALPERHGWFVQAANCDAKWVRHPRGSKKRAGTENGASTHTVVVLLSGRWRFLFARDQREVVLSKSGDYLRYDASEPHENEALEDTHLLVLRWHD